MAITALMEDRITENGHIINLFTRTAPNTWVFKNYIQNYGPGTDGGLTISAGSVEPTQAEKIGAIAELEFDPDNPQQQNESLYFYGQGFPTRDKIQKLGNDALWDDLAGNVSFGAWWYNNAYWVLVPDDANPTICVRKSTDGGVTWTKVDAGNQPNFFEVPGPLFRYDDVTHKIYLWRPDDQNDDTSFVFQAFNLVTELWEAPFGHINLASSENNTNSSNGIIRFPNGDLGVFYYRGNGGNSTLYYRLYASGVWGSEISVAVGTRDTANTGLTVIIDPSKELIHVFYPDTVAGVATLGFNYRTVTHSGTVSGVIFNFPPRQTYGLGFAIINDGNILIPYFDTTGNSSGGQSSVFVAPLATGQFVEELIPVQAGQEATDPYLGFMLFLPAMPASLTLMKTVSGGNASPSAWLLSANGPTPISGNGGASGMVTPGTYILSESGGNNNYIAGSWFCVGGSQTGPNSVVVGANDTVVCTITNLLIGCPTGQPSTIYLWQPSFVEKPETIQDRAGDWDDFGGASYMRGFKLRADSNNNVKFLLFRNADNNNTVTFYGGPLTGAIQHDGEQEITYFFAPPFVSHMARYEPQDTVNWRYFGIEWIKDAWPELSQHYSAWINMGTPEAKFIQGAVIPLDTNGNNTSIVIQNAGGNTTTISANTTAGQKTPVPFSWTPFIGHEVQLIPSGPVRIWVDEIVWVFEPTPEVAAKWITQWTALGSKGYKTVPRIEFAYASNSNVTLTVESFDGASANNVTLPSTSGVMNKVLVTPTFNKGTLYRLSATSNNNDLQVYQNDCIVFRADWGRLEEMYPYKLLGRDFGDQARI